MKTPKKILAGFAVYILSIVLPVVALAPGVSAIDNTVFNGAKYTLTGPGTIQVQLKGLGSEAGPVYTFTDSNPNDDTYNYRYTGSLSDGFVCTIGDNQGITLNGKPPEEPTSITASLGAILLASTPNSIISDCTNPSKIVAAVSTQISVDIPDDSGGGGTGGGGTSGGTQAGNACETTWSNPLTWIVCPVFSIADAFANFLYEEFRNAMCFKVDVAQTSSQTSCEVSPTKDIKPAWSAIKNIVSALLVIIMLIAVFAQAASIGSVDAYTLRKMIPRLVAAVVLIQISFYLFSWIINLVDDIGEGLGSLINAALPGSANISNINFLLGNAGLGQNTIGDQGAWLAVVGILVASAVAAIIALPAVLLLIFVATIALLVAFATLIFRKLLIVALLITAPIALLLWVLPNTERYWKMWWDNFLKILLMFPIIVLIIAAGQLFAFITGPALANGNSLVALFVVMIAFFGPLFILPKTFKWGGTLMALAGNSVSNMAKPVQERGGGALKGWGERKQGEWAKQYNPAASWYSRGLRRIQSGHVLPTERSRRLAIAAGDQWSKDRNDEATAMVNRVYEKALAEGYGGKTGVAAGKQALLDIAGTEKTDDASVRAAQSAIKQLIDTSSWIELQSSTVSRGKNAGKRAVDLGDIWNKTLETSPQHYAATAGRRPDFAPHMVEKYQKEYDKGTFGAVGTHEAIDKRDAARVAQAIGQLKGTDLQSVDQRLYEEIERLGDQEVAVERERPDGTKYTETGTLSQIFGNHLDTIANTPGAGQFNVSQLNGGELGAQVNRALAKGNYGRSLSQIISGGTVPPRDFTAGTAPAEGGEIRVQREGGELVQPPTPPPQGGGGGWSSGPEAPPEPNDQGPLGTPR